MATLTLKARKKLPKADFAGPDRSYPIEDRTHAANAKARAEQQWADGKISKGELQRIKSKANDKLRGA
jgi:hypothetical protein